ncbi:MAG: PQQ-binding-like beta-propeller repeat protein, partial [Chloroflexota bacterium]|nr:PQQ-binding-like beta-propeller repeat protein [Chloroflexota bacterium]
VGGGATVYAVDAAGAALWSFPTGGEIEAAPAVVGGTVYVGSHDGYLYAIGGETPVAPGAT